MINNNTKPYKHLVLDIDGTIVNNEGVISSADISAIALARESGISVTLCTGRSIRASQKILNELNLSGPHIFFDGSLVYDPWKDIEIYSRLLHLELVKDIIDYALQEGIPLDLFSRTDYFALKEDWRTDIRRTFFNVSCKIANFHSLWKTTEIIKAGIAVRTSEEIELARRFATHFGDKVNLTWTTTPALADIQFINIIDKSVSKGRALEALCQHLEVPVEHVCAIGDGPNDISLLLAAGLGIAMRNSPVELIEVADNITKDVADSGVADAIRRFLI